MNLTGTGGVQTFFALGICDLKIKVDDFAQPLLLYNFPLQVPDRNVKTIERNRIEVESTFEFIVHRHL